MKKGVGDDPFAEEEPGEDAGKTEETTPDMGQSPPVETQSDTSFVEDIVQAFEDVESGKEPKSISFRDTSMKALLLALEKNDSARQDLAADLDLSEDADRSTMIRTVLRAGLESESVETYELLAEARAEHARDGV